MRLSPTNQFFPKLSQGTASPTSSMDADDRGGGRRTRCFDLGQERPGTFNAGRYSNRKLDSLIEAMRVEGDLTRRRAMVATVLRFIADDLPMLPLYRRTLTWAMKKNVRAVQWPNDTLELRWVRVQ